MTPIPKPGKPAGLSSSYRPITITSILCRTFERALLRRLMETVRLEMEQYGFREGSSTLEPLLQFCSAAADGMTCQHVRGAACVDVNQKLGEQTFAIHGNKLFRTLSVALDFTDAFCHIRPADVAAALIAKGGHPVYAGLLYDFMTARRMAVRCGSHETGKVPANMGAPQGSVLGPYCWALVCDRLISAARGAMQLRQQTGAMIGFPTMPKKDSGIKKDYAKDSYWGIAFYADDSNIWATGYDVIALHKFLQAGVTALWAEAQRLGLMVSPKSTYTLHTKRLADTKDKELAAMAALKLTVGPLVLPLSQEGQKFLGVFIDRELTFAAHVERVIGGLCRVFGAVASP